MSIRRSLLALAAVAAFGLAACSTGSTTSPGASAGTAAPNVSSAPLMSDPPVAASPAASSAVAGVSSDTGIAGFCADFQAQFADTWPNIDPALGTTLVEKAQEWANDAELADIQTDTATILGWLSIAAASGSIASPPPDVITAMTNIKTFADAHCQS